jgi:hypothetical protein
LLADHVTIICEVQCELKARTKLSNNMDLLAFIVNKLSCNDRTRTILQGKDTGQWLMVLPSMINGTELSTQELLSRFHSAELYQDPSRLSDSL